MSILVKVIAGQMRIVKFSIILQFAIALQDIQAIPTKSVQRLVTTMNSFHSIINAVISVEVPDCKDDSECPSHQACNYQKCIDPCPDPCSSSAICSVEKHFAVCKCAPGESGDPYIRCSKISKLSKAENLHQN